ncbi:MAG TPA: ATP-grasp fold amidoligase family protein [Candidatus Saccharimonadales bacterium]|nr:ATP-grasp fold amidoligase family protein [Candidatus Saccharimonadales bacterium]
MRARTIDLLPDKVYVPLVFYKRNKRFPNLRNPQRLSDKVQWLKLNGNMERFAPFADKYTVRAFIEQKIGAQYLVPLLGVWDNFDDIPFAKLPEQFVLKVTHGCGYNYICKDKAKIDMLALKAKITGWQQEDFYKQEREPQYKPCVPRIICEAYLEDPTTKDLPDYKIYCAKGEPKAVQVDTDRFVDHKSALLGLNWELLDYVRVTTFDGIQTLPKKPDNLPEMLQIARKLSENFPFVRVDLYSIGDKVYFGELTFTPGSGWVSLQPVSGEIEFAQMIDLAAYKHWRGDDRSK